MSSTVAALGLAVFGVLAVIYLTTELASAIVGRDRLPPMLRPLANADRAQQRTMGDLLGRFVLVVLIEGVILGVLVTGIAGSDALTQLLLVGEVVASAAWIIYLTLHALRQGRT